MPEVLLLAEYVPMTDGLMEWVRGALPVFAKIAGGVFGIVGVTLIARKVYFASTGKRADGVPR